MWIWISPGGLAMMAIVLIPLVSTNPNPNSRAVEKTSLTSNTVIQLLKEVITNDKEVISTQNRILTALLDTSRNVRKDDVVHKIEDRSRRPGEKISNKIARLSLYQNHLVRFQDLGLTWKLEFDITLFKMPAYDKHAPINIFHLTQNGNDDKDNIIKLSIIRQGSHGKFIFKYWTHTKTLLFSLGTPYHVVFELYKNSRGRKKYEFEINVDDDNLVHTNLKDIQQVPKAYKSVKLFCSNPWEKTLPSKVGIVKNFVIPRGISQRCCNMMALKIKSSNDSLQKNKIGEYVYNGQMNGRGFWKSTDGRSAIWYYPAYQEWMIGSKCYLGTKFRGISARQTSVSCPDHNHKRWTYWNGHKWLTDQNHQIELVCLDDYSEQKQVNCHWSKWGQWTACSKSCGNGYNLRKRTKATTAKNGGKDCIGQSISKKSCLIKHCPENCKWSSWGAWGACSKTCGKGLKLRSRKVAKQAKYGGGRCYGSHTTRRSCLVTYCPVTIKKGFLKKTYPTWNKIYSVSFRIIVKRSDGGWRKVMHFTTGRDYGAPGSRIPVVWIIGSRQICISSTVSGNNDYHRYFNLGTLGKQYDITIQQTKENGKYWYQIIINGSTVFKVPNTQPRIFSNVKEYLSAPWGKAFTSDYGTVSNLKIKLQ